MYELFRTERTACIALIKAKKAGTFYSADRATDEANQQWATFKRYNKAAKLMDQVYKLDDTNQIWHPRSNHQLWARESKKNAKQFEARAKKLKVIEDHAEQLASSEESAPKE